MQDTKDQIIVTILAVVATMLFLGILLIFMLWSYNNKKRKMLREKESMRADFAEQLLHSKLEIQEHVFNHISREFHDNVGQILSLAKIQLNIMDQKEELDKPLLGDAMENISKAMSDLRDIAKGLSSERIQLLNLQETIADEVQRINKTGMMLATVQVFGSEQTMNEQTKLIIFRIIQECLQNIIKHSGAAEVRVSFDYEKDQIKVVVEDDGKGFDALGDSFKVKGLGLQNIVHRAALLGGFASIDSAPGTGTKISINIPYG
jgi:signal transduction histidine kinase